MALPVLNMVNIFFTHRHNKRSTTPILDYIYSKIQDKPLLAKVVKKVKKVVKKFKASDTYKRFNKRSVPILWKSNRMPTQQSGPSPSKAKKDCSCRKLFALRLVNYECGTDGNREGC